MDTLGGQVAVEFVENAVVQTQAIITPGVITDWLPVQATGRFVVADDVIDQTLQLTYYKVSGAGDVKIRRARMSLGTV